MSVTLTGPLATYMQPQQVAANDWRLAVIASLAALGGKSLAYTLTETVNGLTNVSTGSLSFAAPANEADIPPERRASVTRGDSSLSTQARVTWSEPLDPSDVLPFRMDFDTVLLDGETITSFVLGPTAAGVALGLLVTGATVTEDEGGLIATIAVDSSFQANGAFSNSGSLLAVEGSIVTSHELRYDRTIYLKVVQL